MYAMDIWRAAETMASVVEMARTARSSLPDGIFHVTARGNAREVIFRDGIDYADFERELYRVRDEFLWTLHAYCLLPNHYHLVVGARREDLSTGMQRLNGRYAQWFNGRYERVGHVFQNRFKSYVVETEEHFERALAYVSLNRVKAGLCGTPLEWPWRGGPSDSD